MYFTDDSRFESYLQRKIIQIVFGFATEISAKQLMRLTLESQKKEIKFHWSLD